MERKKVRPADMFFIGFGSIVGVGWAVAINSWMTLSGGPVPAALGYIIVLVMLVPVALCYAELVPMLPVAGGGMAFAYKAFDERLAALSGWAVLGGMICIPPWEAIQITDVLGYLIPGLKTGTVLYNSYGSDIYLVVVLIGTAFALILFALNMRGLAAATKVQRALCVILLVSAVIGAIAALCGGKLENLEPIYDVSNPEIYGDGLRQVTHATFLGGCFAIVAQAAYFLSGFENIAQGVEDVGGNVRTVGKMVIFSVTAASLFYAILLLCFGYAWPWQEFAKLSRPASATMFLLLYPNGVGKVLYWVITIGALAGLISVWNGFFTSTANMMMGMSRGRLIPKAWQYQNKKGIAVVGLVSCLFLSVLGPLLGANLLDAITSFSATAFTLSWCISTWSLVVMRKKYPDMKRPYKVPGGIVTGYIAAILTTIVLVCMLIPQSPFYVGSVAVKMFIGWIVLGVGMYILSGRRRKGKTKQELEDGVFGQMNE